MNLKLTIVCVATALLAGCSKCSQQPQTDAPAATEAPAAQEAPQAEAQPVEAGSAEAAAPSESMPNSEQINEELPTEESGK